MKWTVSYRLLKFFSSSSAGVNTCDSFESDPEDPTVRLGVDIVGAGVERPLTT